MPTYFNGVELTPGEKQYYNSTHVTDIYYNGIKVYQYDNEPPVITVTSLTGDTSLPYYTLTGTVVDAHSGVQSVTINGVGVQLIDGAFSSQHWLVTGSNTFTIAATDKAGNTGTTVVNLNYVLPAGYTSTFTGTRGSYGDRNDGDVIISYSGNRNSNSCSVHMNTGAVSEYNDPDGKPLGSGCETEHIITSSIFPGASTITLSATFWPTDANTKDLEGKVVDVYGNTSATLSAGTNNISAYADGRHYVYVRSRIWQYRDGRHNVRLDNTITMSP